jgi:hypothetical protein
MNSDALYVDALAAPATTGQVYGIIDPDYGRAYTMIRKLAWDEGYAIGLHGSFTRDLDLIAVPWTDAASEPEHLVRRIEFATGLQGLHGNPGKKPQGRLVWTLMFPNFGDPRFIDLSIMPRVGAASSGGSSDAAECSERPTKDVAEAPGPNEKDGQGAVALHPPAQAARLTGWSFRVRPSSAVITSPTQGRWTVWHPSSGGNALQGLMYELAAALADAAGDDEPGVIGGGWAASHPLNNTPAPIDAYTLAGVRRYLNDVLADGTPNEQTVARTVSRMLVAPPTPQVHPAQTAPAPVDEPVDVDAPPTAMELYARFDEQAETRQWRRLARIEKDSWRSIAWIVGTILKERLPAVKTEGGPVDVDAIAELYAAANELHGTFDQQTYDEKRRAEWDLPDEHEFSVTITAAQERALSRAIIACEKVAAPPAQLAPAPVDTREAFKEWALAKHYAYINDTGDWTCPYGEWMFSAWQEATRRAALAAPVDEPVDVDARKLAWELAGVLEDVKRDGFDDVCLRTIQRVHAALVAQEVHPVPRQLREWAALQDESDGSPWSEGYEAARRYVAMQISQQPDQGRSGSLPSGGSAAAPRSSGDEADRLALDAARYRWIRAEHALQYPVAAVVWKRNNDRTGHEWVNSCGPDSLDAAIDSMRKEQP